MKKRMLGSVTLAVKDLVIRTEPESAMMSYHRLGEELTKIGGAGGICTPDRKSPLDRGHQKCVNETSEKEVGKWGK